MTKHIDKQAIAKAFGRAATSYDNFAALQRTSGNHLIHRLAGRPAEEVLDAGCGTGWFSRYWQTQGSRVTALDLSASMLNQARENQAAAAYLEGDIELLPLADEQFTLAWSNLVLQWCSDLHQGLSELYRVTRPGGCVAFTTLAANSLPEVRAAWRAVDEREHANQLMAFKDVQAACSAWKTSLKIEEVTQYFPDVISAMRSLKGTGATHLHAGRKSTLMTRRQLQLLSFAWPQKEGKFPLTWQLVSGVIERD